jgi:hypothetical protein
VAIRIRPIADAEAGEASHIAVRAFNESEVLTAVSDGSGDLLLIGWHTPPGDAAITRAADSLQQAGTAREVALTLMGRRAITAVRSGSDKLLLISWDVPEGLGSITRLEDSGTAALDASQIAMTAIGGNRLVTALRNGDGDLLLICWRLEEDGVLSRLGDSEDQAGEVSAVTIAALDEANVVTAVRNGSGNLQLIGWSVSPEGELHRWDGNVAEAGEVGAFAILPMATAGPTTDVLTAVQDGSGNLLLIAWRASPGSRTVERLADSSSEAGAATNLAMTSTVTPAGTSVVLVSMRRGGGNLGVIAFELIADAAGATIIRTGDFANRDDTDVTETDLTRLESGRILSASRIDDNLELTTYSVSQRVITLIRPIADARERREPHRRASLQRERGPDSAPRRLRESKAHRLAHGAERLHAHARRRAAGGHGAGGRAVADRAARHYRGPQRQRQAAVDFVGRAGRARLDHPRRRQRHRRGGRQPDCDDRDRRRHAGHCAS